MCKSSFLLVLKVYYFNVVSATWVAGPFLILHYFFLLRFPLQKILADLPVLGCPKGLTFGLSSFKASKFHLFRPNFWLLFPLLFFPSELIPSYQVESFPATFLHGSSFWVSRGTNHLFMNCWFPSLLISFLHQWVVDRDISVLVSCVSWHALLNYPSSSVALLHVPRILGT